MAGGIGRHVVVAVGRVPADEVDRVVHAEAVVARVLAVEAELALDRRRRGGARGDRVDLVDLAMLGEHHHLPGEVGLDVLAGARVLELEAALALGELLEDLAGGLLLAGHAVDLAVGEHGATGGAAVGGAAAVDVAEVAEQGIEHLRGRAGVALLEARVADPEGATRVLRAGVPRPRGEHGLDPVHARADHPARELELPEARVLALRPHLDGLALDRLLAAIEHDRDLLAGAEGPDGAPDLDALARRDLAAANAVQADRGRRRLVARVLLGRRSIALIGGGGAGNSRVSRRLGRRRPGPSSGPPWRPAPERRRSQRERRRSRGRGRGMHEGGYGSSSGAEL